MPLRNSDGEVIAWYAATYDIEDRKRAEDALRRSQSELAKARQDLQLAIDTISTMVVVLDHDGRPYFANQPAQEYIGKGFPIEKVRDLIHPDDRSRIDRLWRTHLVTGEPFQTEQRMRRADGPDHPWTNMSRVPLRDETGKVIKWYGSGYDIEDRKQAEAALQERGAARGKPAAICSSRSIPFQSWCRLSSRTARAVLSIRRGRTTPVTRREKRPERESIPLPIIIPTMSRNFENAWRTAQARGERSSSGGGAHAQGRRHVSMVYDATRTTTRRQGKRCQMVFVGIDVEEQRNAEEAQRRSDGPTRQGRTRASAHARLDPDTAWRTRPDGYAGAISTSAGSITPAFPSSRRWGGNRGRRFIPTTAPRCIMRG